MRVSYAIALQCGVANKLRLLSTSKIAVSMRTYTRFLSAARRKWKIVDDTIRDERGKSLFSLHFELCTILNNELLAKATFAFWEDYTDRNVRKNKYCGTHSVALFTLKYFY